MVKSKVESPQAKPTSRKRSASISKQSKGKSSSNKEKSQGKGAAKAKSKGKGAPMDFLKPVAVKLNKVDGVSDSVAFLLAHGAGGKSDSPQMIRYRNLLAKLGTVFQFDYPGP